MTLVEDITNLVDRVKVLSLSQKPLWQKIPLRALQADGRSGYSDQYGTAYEIGYWKLESSIANGLYGVCVDLATGELVDAGSILGNSMETYDGPVDFPPMRERRLASESSIIFLLRFPEKLIEKELNAQHIIESLENQSKEPYFSGYDSEEQEAWRQETRQRLDLEEVFTRK